MSQSKRYNNDLPSSKLTTMYKAMRELYISKYNKNFKEVADKIHYAYTVGNIQRTSEDTYNEIAKSMTFITLKGANNLPPFSQFESALNEIKEKGTDLQKRLDNFKLVIDTFSLIGEFLKTTNHKSLPSNIITGINRFETLLKVGTVKSKNRGMVSSMDDFAGTINDMLGSLAEVYALLELESALDGIDFDIATTGTEKHDIKLNKQLTLKKVMNSRDISVTYKKNKIELSVGITVKKYNLNTKGTSYSIKLRDSKFNIVYKYLASGGTSTFPIGEMIDRQRLSEMFTVGIHEYKKYGANIKSQSNFSNIKEVVTTLQKISGMALLDMLVGQGDFQKMGLQILILNGELLNFDYILPKKIPSAQGLSPAALQKASPLGSGNPSYDEAIDTNSYDRYLERYNNLNLVLRETINLAKLKKNKGGW